eukprot:TRINITY_DN69743_c0_g1_i1.p1 TRINITY_DN69743_c0_g1~~TRINITY_DN69743_c0_g1_i1.p1  ORF type:complete len:301 (-),score=47.62 TRINITY_DN69743_c0_g1_i1:331-1233(-)
MYRDRVGTIDRTHSPNIVTVEDPYQNILKVPEDVLEALAEAMEARYVEASKTGLLRKILGDATQGLCSGSSGGIVVADVGCGTGSVTAAIGNVPGVGEVIGIDPSPFFLEKARRRFSPEETQVRFCEGWCTDLPLADESVDLVMLVNLLSHLPLKQHVLALQEARRVLKEGGRILLQDNDICSWTMTLGPTDPLTAPVQTLLAALATSHHTCRLFPTMLDSAGFAADKLTIHNVVDDDEDTYAFKYVLLRSIKMFHHTGQCSKELADALVGEAKRRAADKKFQALLSFGVCMGYKYARSP